MTDGGRHIDVSIILITFNSFKCSFSCVSTHICHINYNIFFTFTLCDSLVKNILNFFISF